MTSSQHDLDIPLGHDRELVVRGRYETASIANDILIGLWFLIGSVLFFGDATAYAGTWLFVVGSVEMLIRPVIHIARRFHLQRLGASPGRESGADF